MGWLRRKKEPVTLSCAFVKKSAQRFLLEVFIGLGGGEGSEDGRKTYHTHNMKINLKCKKGLQRWKQGLKSLLRACKSSATKQQPSACPVLIYERPTKQLQVIWADAVEAPQMARAAANLFTASLKQFQNQFGI